MHCNDVHPFCVAFLVTSMSRAHDALALTIHHYIDYVLITLFDHPLRMKFAIFFLDMYHCDFYRNSVLNINVRCGNCSP